MAFQEGKRGERRLTDSTTATHTPSVPPPPPEKKKANLGMDGTLSSKTNLDIRKCPIHIKGWLFFWMGE